jgi:hypothetical protein
MAYRVERSPVRLFLAGIVGIVLLLAAADITFGHWLSTAPETSEEGAITTRGRSQRRADFAWGAVFLVGGAGLFGYAVTSLVRRRPVMVIDEEGLELYITGPTSDPARVPWSDLLGVHSAAEDDPDGGRSVDVMVFDLAHRGAVPDEPWGAQWEGGRLKLDASGWDEPVGEVGVRIELDLAGYRRDRAVDDLALEEQADEGEAERD